MPHRLRESDLYSRLIFTGVGRMNKRNVFIFLVVFLCILSVGSQEIQNSDFPRNLIGVWPDSDNLKGATEKEFSWGIGIFPLHGAIVIDYDNEGNLYLDNPGLGRYSIESFKYLTQDKVELGLNKQNYKKNEYIAAKGSVIVTFVSENEIKIGGSGDDSGYERMFGGKSVYKRLSPP